MVCASLRLEYQPQCKTNTFHAHFTLTSWMHIALFRMIYCRTELHNCIVAEKHTNLKSLCQAYWNSSGLTLWNTVLNYSHCFDSFLDKLHNHPLPPLICTSGYKHVMKTWYDTVWMNVNMLHSVWHLQNVIVSVICRSVNSQYLILVNGLWV